MYYVNAYEVTLGYGGPEEGGWWFDCGHPLFSMPVVEGDARGEDRARGQIKAMFGQKYADCPDKSSVRSDAADLWVRVEDHAAVAFPEFRPHYE